MHSCPYHYFPSLESYQLQPIGSGGGRLSQNRKVKKTLVRGEGTQ